MATDLERLVVSLSADIKSFEKSMAKASGVSVRELRKINSEATKEMGRFEKTMGRAGASLAGFGKGLVLGGIATAVAGLTAIVSSSVSTAAAIGDLSDKLGISTTKLQELQYGAVQANLGFEEMEKGLLKFSKSLAEAQNGQGDLLKLLEANGFSKAQIKALDYSQALDAVADLIKNAANEQDALLIATQAFGRGAGDEYVEFLRKGSEGLKEFAKEAHSADAIIKEGLIKSAQSFDDAWAAAMLSVKAKLGDLVLSAIPLIQRLDKAFNDSARRFGVAIGTLDPAVVDTTTPVSGPKTRSRPRSTKGDREPVTVIPDPEAEAAKKKAREAALRDYEAQQKAINGVIEALNFEIKQGKVSELQQQINNELRKAGATATEAQKQQIIELTTAKFNQTQAEEALIDFSEKQLELDQELIESKMALAEIAVDAFDAIVVGGEKAEDVLKGLVKQLASAAIRATLLGQGPLAGLFGTSAGGGFFGNLFGGARADGGPVTAGKTYLVGERGPELFRATQPGQIIPKGKMGGQQNITFAPQIDARGADAGAVARLTNDLRTMQREFAKNVRNVVSGEKALNPRFAR